MKGKLLVSSLLIGGVLVGGTCGFIIPSVIGNTSRTNNSNVENNVINFNEKLKDKSTIKYGQNYLELSVQANHENGKELKYQWMYKPVTKNKGKQSDWKVFDLNNSGLTSKLILVDDIEKFYGYEFACIAYDEDKNYNFSQTKIDINIEDTLIDTYLTVSDISNLINNIPIWSKYFWNSNSNFENNSIINSSLLYKNILKLLNSYNNDIFKSIDVNKNSNDTFDLILNLKNEYEFSKDLYLTHNLGLENVKIANQAITISGLSSNDTKILDIDLEKLKNYLSDYSEKSISSLEVDELKQLILDSNSGFNNIEEIDVISCQSSLVNKNQEYTIIINLSNGYYSSDLTNKLMISNIESSDNNGEVIDLAKIDFLNLAYNFYESKVVNYNAFWRSKNNINNLITVSKTDKSEYFEILSKILKVNPSNVNRYEISFYTKNNLSYENIEDYKWVLPLKFNIIFNDDLVLSNQLPSINKINFSDSWTEVKLEKNGSTITFTSNLVGSKLGLEIINKIVKKNYSITKYAIEIFNQISFLADSGGEGSYDHGNHYFDCDEENCWINLYGYYATVWHLMDGFGQKLFDSLYELSLFPKDSIEGMEYILFEDAETMKQLGCKAKTIVYLKEYYTFYGERNISYSNVDLYNISNDKFSAILIEDTFVPTLNMRCSHTPGYCELKK